MDTILQITTGVLAANLLTVAFVYGMYWAFRTKSDDHPSYTVYLAILLPALVLIGGIVAYR